MSDTARFSEKHLLGHKPSFDLVQYRDLLCSKFNRQISLLLESKAPKKQNTVKGRLNTRLAYRMPFSETIFSKYQHIPSSDTTIVFLIDGSGSMGSSEGAFDRIGLCSAVVSAFSKSVSKVLKDQIKVEVMVKSAPCLRGSNMEGVKGSFVTLTRVFSNTKKDKDFDKLLSLDCYSPLEQKESAVGSYTAEYSVLPCLMDWAKKNVTTKNMVVFNLTDGESYASLGDDNFRFGNENTAELKTKYLRGVPNMTLLIGREIPENTAKRIYGQDLVVSEDSCFVNPMMKNLIKIIDGEVN
jgi:hypothetical protein